LGVLAGDIIKASRYHWNALERYCAKQGVDPSDYLSRMTELILDMVQKSEEARGAFFKGASSQNVSEIGSDGHNAKAYLPPTCSALKGFCLSLA